MHRRFSLCAAAVAVAATLTGASAASAGPAARGTDARSAAVARALGHLRAANAGQEFRVRDVVLDADGSEHVRADRFYRGLEVLGGDVVVHGRRDGSLKPGNALARAIRLSTTPSVSAATAAAIGAATLRGTVTRSTPRLVVHAFGAPQLAWETVVEGTTADGDPAEPHVFVSATTGRVIDSWDGIETVDGQGNSLYLGTVPVGATQTSATAYQLKDAARGNGYTTDLNGGTTGIGTPFTGTDNVWGTGAHGSTGAARETAGVDAHFGMGVTWDYYKNEHNRLGIANDGKGTYSRVHYGSNYDNAFWSDSCFCMTFGDGDGSTDLPLVSLDIAGHEMTHGITSRTANLAYRAESGGLNEATSDIFGTMVEFYAANSGDPGDYDIGEEILLPYTGDGFRYMYHPSLDGASPDCWSKTIGRLNVHYSSGVANRFFFLLAEGTNSPYGDGLAGCKGAPAVTGIGRVAAGRIWYRALTVYMTSKTAYVGARDATIRAAADLGYSTATVKSAWNSVGVPVSAAG